MKLSIVATLYRSSATIREFHRRIKEVALSIAPDDHEIILVNDGSPDDSLDTALLISQNDPNLVIVDLSRNFGHHKAILQGLKQARGERVFLIDSDLEEAPELALEFADVMDRESCDVVYGIQKSRKGKRFEKWSGAIFWKLIRFLSGIPLPSNIATARLMSSRYVHSLLEYPERDVFLAGLWHITGYNQKGVYIEKLYNDNSTYDLRAKIHLAVNSITSFSNAPLVMIFYTGTIILLISIIFLVFIVVNWLVFSSIPSGWTSVIASIWLLGGLVISFMGVIGIYLSKMFTEVKARPRSIVRQIYGRK